MDVPTIIIQLSQGVIQLQPFKQNINISVNSIIKRIAKNTLFHSLLRSTF